MASDDLSFSMITENKTYRHMYNKSQHPTGHVDRRHDRRHDRHNKQSSQSQRSTEHKRDKTIGHGDIPGQPSSSPGPPGPLYPSLPSTAAPTSGQSPLPGASGHPSLTPTPTPSPFPHRGQEQLTESFIHLSGSDDTANPCISSLKLKQWTDDMSVNSCSHCKAGFSLINRRHHCRHCGGVFCGTCTDKKIVIPDFIAIPTPPCGYTIDRMLPVRVCHKCHHKIIQLSDLSNMINSMSSMDLTIEDIAVMGKVCKLWREYCFYYLSKFRELQYVMPNHVFTDKEKNILWANRYILVGHDVWIAQLLKSVDYQDVDRLAEINIVMTKHIDGNNRPKCKGECFRRMCTRYCCRDLSVTSALMILDSRILYEPIHQYGLKRLSKCQPDELLCYIPYLVCQGVLSPFDVIGNWLITKSKRSIVIANEIYWAIKVGMSADDPVTAGRYRYLMLKWDIGVPTQYKNKILSGNKLVDSIEGKNVGRRSSSNDLSLLKRRVRNVGMGSSPLCIDHDDSSVVVDGIGIKKSATNPVVLPRRDGSMILYKQEDIRQDWIVMSVIRVIDRILRSEGFDLNIVMYDILPTSVNSGLIGIVTDGRTLYDIKEKDGRSLLAHLIHNSPDLSAGQLKQNIVKSCAAYCVITYLLGVGDRHLENIMVTPDGSLFHIDYGFILGKDPKLLSTPDIRISEDMVDALGGQDTVHYKEFKDLCRQIYVVLRRHVNLITMMLSVLCTMNPKINTTVTSEDLYREVLTRFVPGEKEVNIEIQLSTRIDNSTTRSYRYHIIDAFHRSAASDGILSKLNGGLSNVREWWSALSE